MAGFIFVKPSADNRIEFILPTLPQTERHKHLSSTRWAELRQSGEDKCSLDDKTEPMEPAGPDSSSEVADSEMVIIGGEEHSPSDEGEDISSEEKLLFLNDILGIFIHKRKKMNRATQ